MSETGALTCEAGKLERPALVLHGGAGTFARLSQPGGDISRADLEEALTAALRTGWDVLSSGGPSLAAAVEAVAFMESSGLFNAGRGAVATTAGTVETDASVMDGATGAAGAVCAATWPANPVRAALALARYPVEPSGPRWRPLLLAGAGADHFAQEVGLEPSPGLAREGPETGLSAGAGTVGAVALDRSGTVAAATSTGGRAGQPPGRVGDSAIVGAGTWADNGTAAISATGAGEAFIMAGFGHLADWFMRNGASLPDALRAALGAVSKRGGTGGAIAVAPSGDFAAIFGTPAMARGWQSPAGPVVRI
ncbi:MAG: isoaspartyl peptidase/L-asparaginase family protein [Acidimicrobiales bacterium]